MVRLGAVLTCGIYIFKFGPLAWDGILGFWFAVTTYFTWVIVTTVMTLKAIEYGNEIDDIELRLARLERHISGWAGVEELVESDVIRSYRRAILAVGAITLTAVFIHGIWLCYFENYPALHGVSGVQMATFEMMNAAITLFLVFMAVSACCDRGIHLQQIRFCALLLAGFWLLRFLLELVSVLYKIL